MIHLRRGRLRVKSRKRRNQRRARKLNRRRSAMKSNSDFQEEDDLDVVPFSYVTAVATKWMLDFHFYSLCRCFREGKREEFAETLSTFESHFTAIFQCDSLRGNIVDDQKFMICALMARIVHAKQLEDIFEEDKKVMPLMSAAKLWLQLKTSVSDEDQFQNIMSLLVVQSVAVCLTNGKPSAANYVLKWLENAPYIPQNFQVKLNKVVEKGDMHHPLLLCFNFDRLMTTFCSFLDAYLRRNPCDFIFKEATKMVQKCRSKDSCENMRRQNPELNTDELEKSDAKKAKTTSIKKKRKLLLTKTQELWMQHSPKMPHVSLSRIPEDELRQPVVVQKPQTTLEKKRKPPQKWTKAQDEQLKKGVTKFGPGKWARILLEYDFEGRSGVMLKDRWRVLVKHNLVH